MLGDCSTMLGLIKFAIIECHAYIAFAFHSGGWRPSALGRFRRSAYSPLLSPFSPLPSPFAWEGAQQQSSFARDTPCSRDVPRMQRLGSKWKRLKCRHPANCTWKKYKLYFSIEREVPELKWMTTKHTRRPLRKTRQINFQASFLSCPLKLNRSSPSRIEIFSMCGSNRCKCKCSVNYWAR